jgi:DENN (AEX-3) domain
MPLHAGAVKLACHVDSQHVTRPCRLVLPGKSLENEVVFSMPPPTALPVSSHPVEVLFQYMGPRGAIDLLSCALCEKKILLHSYETSKLVVIGEGLRALLYPLKWTHVYVPIVPVDLLNLVEAPVPFILGNQSPKLCNQNL